MRASTSRGAAASSSRRTFHKTGVTIFGQTEPCSWKMVANHDSSLYGTPISGRREGRGPARDAALLVVGVVGLQLVATDGARAVALEPLDEAAAVENVAW